MLVSAKDMLQKAAAGKYAVGQFNINNLEWTKAILGVVGAIEHDAGEACLNALERALVGAVIQVQGYGHRDTQLIDHGADHGEAAAKSPIPLSAR